MKHIEELEALEIQNVGNAHNQLAFGLDFTEMAGTVLQCDAPYRGHKHFFYK